MPIDASHYKQLILLRVGDSAPNNSGPVASNIDTIWQLSANEPGALLPQGHYLLALKTAIDIMLGAVWTGDFITTGDKTEALDDRVNVLQQMKTDVQEELALLTKQFNSLRGPVVVQLKTNAPINPADNPNTVGYPDSNAPYYRGSPYYPRRRTP